MEVSGAIKLIKDTEVVSDKFQKRCVVVTTQEKYPQDIMIEFTQDKCDLLDDFGVGQVVEVGINLRGREWTSPQGEVKYFNTIQGWKISASKDESLDPNPPTSAGFEVKDNEGDDLPF